MSSTNMNELELGALTEGVLAMTDAHGAVGDGPLRETAGSVDVDGNFESFGCEVSGSLSASGAMKVLGDTVIHGAISVGSLAGAGTRPVAARPDGVLVPSRPGTQQILVHHSDADMVPSDTSPLYPFGSPGGFLMGSASVPRSWMQRGRGLELMLDAEWQKQSGIGSALYFGVSFRPADSAEVTLVEIPVATAADEAIGGAAGFLSVSVDFEFVLGTTETQARLLANACVRRAYSSPAGHDAARVSDGVSVSLSAVEGEDGAAELRPYFRFTDASGTNRVTVRVARLASRELVPLNI